METNNPGDLLVYKASAGSGKTFTLVKEYLSIALQSDNAFKHILAITFTNKAANEMKERILKNLRELSDPKKYSREASNLYIRPRLIEQLQCTDIILSKKAAAVLSNMLHNYSDLAILTIDSFLHRIVQTFASDLELPVGFDTDTNINKLYQQALDLVVDQAGRDDKLTKVFNHYQKYQVKSEKSWDIAPSLFKFFTGNITSDENIKLLESLTELNTDDFIEVGESAGKALQYIESQFQNTAKKFKNIADNYHLTNDDFYNKGNGILAHIGKLSTGKEVFPKTETVYFKKALEGTLANKNTTNAGLIEQHATEMLDILNELVSLKERYQSRYILILAMRDNIYPLSLQNEIFKTAETIKHENRMVYIADFNRKIGKVVQSEPIPFIFERVGEWYNYIMIDEFQDTSLMQWQNLLPLVDNALSGGHKSMIVGDAKQAIYRWRGGNASQFSELPELPREFDSNVTLFRQENLRNHYHEEHLQSNFRSKREIIEFNNWFFEKAKQHLPDSQKDIYAHHSQKFNPSNFGGSIKVELTPYSHQEDEYHALVFDSIQQALEKGFRYKDMAILVRTNATGSAVATFLTAKKIPVFTAESLLISKSRDVQFLLALIRCREDAQNREDAFTILNYLTKLIPGFDASIAWKKLIFHDTKENPVWNFLKNLFPELLKNNSTRSLFDITEHFIHIFIPQANRNAYIRYFLEEVYRFGENSRSNSFIEFWEERKDKASLEFSEGIDAVSIMTIHKSKGLEFPVVILPVCDSRFKISNDKFSCQPPEEVSDLLKKFNFIYFNAKKDLIETSLSDIYNEEVALSMADNVNLLYVAMTRASDRLHIICSNKKFCEKGQLPGFNGLMSEMVVMVCSEHDSFDKETAVLYIELTENKTIADNTENSSLQMDASSRFTCIDWRNAVTLSAPSMQQMEEGERNARAVGVLVHQLLATIHHSNDLDKAIKDASENGTIGINETTEIRDILLSVLTHPELKQYFTGGYHTLNEREIITPEGNTYRPDRVVTNGKSATIIDYKTGKESAHHKAQIAQYGNLLQRMGYDTEKKILIYINENAAPKVIYC